MVAVIKTGHSIHRILNYNENKVTEGVATLLAAQNYPIDADKLSFSAKLNMLLHQAALNENVTRNSVHISLNFDPSESLSGELLAEIADGYMSRIGFGEQPYLVYQHFDAGHPHIHIVSVKVRADGSRVDTQNIGRNQSEKARRELEETYGLKKAQDSKPEETYRLQPVNVQKAMYGRSGTKRAITTVLDAVINGYAYTSLPELNAILGLYNVYADRGSEGSRIFQHHGLTYRMLDSDGNGVGVPIKASDFYSKPTLSNLEKKFLDNGAKRQSHKARIKNLVDLAFVRQPSMQVSGLAANLEKEGVSIVIRKNDDGIVYGLTYVDHHSRCVFNGSALGKRYSAKGILDRCGVKAGAVAAPLYFVSPPYVQTHIPPDNFKVQGKTGDTATGDLFTILLEPERTFDLVPAGLRKGKKKRKKRNNNRL